MVWHAGELEPRIILTDQPPAEVGVSSYALRCWIELGFQAIKSLGWQWHKTGCTDPTSISRHWLALVVAALLAMAYGTSVEDAINRKIAPGNLRTPPKAPSPKHPNSQLQPVRAVSVIRYGVAWLRRLLHQGRLWRRLWLLPEPWPDPNPNMQVILRAPS